MSEPIAPETVDRFNRFATFCKECGLLDATLLSEAQSLADCFASDVRDISESGRKIRIGVVGQVKAGKSSFLNAMLLDGRPILPKAATPMTAALTILRYGPKTEAEVEFFSKEDWETIVAKAEEAQSLRKEAKDAARQARPPQKSGFAKLVDKVAHVIADAPEAHAPRRPAVEIPEDLRAAEELVEKSNRVPGGLDALLGKTKKIDDIAKLEDLKGKLQDYVGADGVYTALTKSLTLTLNIEDLKEVEVIDTPGINDPIVSRGARTREFLGKCDAVFLLSYSGQFVGSVEAGFLTDSLPNKGISRVVLVGSKFDSVLIDEGRKYGGQLKEAIRDLRHKLGAHAESSLRPIIEASSNNELMKSVGKCLPPVFISGMAYNLAVKDQSSWDEEERVIVDRIQELFPDFPLNKENLLDLSNIPAIKEKQFAAIRTDKEAILAGRLADRVSGAGREFAKLWKNASKTLDSALNDLKTRDKTSLEEEARRFKKGLDDADEKIRDHFDDFIEKIETAACSIESEFSRAVCEFEQLQEIDESKDEAYTVIVTKRSCLSWLVSWFDTTEEQTRYRTVHHQYAKVQDAIEKVRSIIRKNTESFKNEWKRTIKDENLKKFKTNLTKAVVDHLPSDDPSFDAKKAYNAIRQAAERIDVPSLAIDASAYTARITSKFSGATRVMDNDVDKLKSIHSDVLYDCTKDMVERMTAASVAVKSKLEGNRDKFVSEIKSQIDARLAQITQLMQDKEKSVTAHESAIRKLKEFTIKAAPEK